MKIPSNHRCMRRGLVACLVCGLVGAVPASAQQLDDAMDASERTVEDTSDTQARINKLDDQTQKLVNQYRANLKQLEQLQRYNKSQRRQVEAQEKELASLQKDINNISSLQRSVQPLMDDMQRALGKLVTSDLPFLPQERRQRVERLRKMMEDPNKSPAERYRLLVEAYQIENEYGRTIGTYRGDVTTTGGTKYENVQFLRIGRLALIFKTDDDQVLKIYDADAEQWTDLDQSYLGGVKTAVRLAKEQIPPQLLAVPLPKAYQAEAGQAMPTQMDRGQQSSTPAVGTEDDNQSAVQSGDKPASNGDSQEEDSDA